MTHELPGWSRRTLLHDAVRALGLPWIPSAIVPGATTPAPTYGEAIDALGLTGRIAQEMRRRLPRGVSGAAVDGEQLELAHKLARAIAASREQLEEDEDDDDDLPAVAVVQVGPKPRGPAPGGVGIVFTERNGGKHHAAK